MNETKEKKDSFIIIIWKRSVGIIGTILARPQLF